MTFPERIKEWLKATDKDRFWLAEKTHSSKKTVDGWLSAGKSIPLAKQDIIESLMKESRNNQPLQDLKNIPDLGKLFVNFTPELQEKIAQEALRQGMTPNAFISKLVEWYVTTEEGREKAIKALSFNQGELQTTYLDNGEEPSSRVAEDFDEYGKPTK